MISALPQLRTLLRSRNYSPRKPSGITTTAGMSATTQAPVSEDNDWCSHLTPGESMMRECDGKKLCDDLNQKSVSDLLMPHILNLYGACATPQDFEIYAPDASFEDPLMCANGVDQIKSAFYSLSKVFRESRIVEYTVKESTMPSGKQEILIDNKQYYKFLGRDIDMTSLIRLYVENGKVVRHEDWWDKKPFGNRDTAKSPLIGRFQELLRRGSMLATHTMMGFGKDPTADS